LPVEAWAWVRTRLDGLLLFLFVWLQGERFCFFRFSMAVRLAPGSGRMIFGLGTRLRCDEDGRYGLGKAHRVQPGFFSMLDESIHLDSQWVSWLQLALLDQVVYLGR